MTRAMAGALAGRRVDLFIDLHGDWEAHGITVINESRGENHDRWDVVGRGLSALRSASLTDAPAGTDRVSDYKMRRLGTGEIAKPDEFAGGFDWYMARRSEQSGDLATDHGGDAPWSLTLEASRAIKGGQSKELLRLTRSLIENIHRAERGHRRRD